MSTETCIWSDLFDENEKISLEEGFVTTGFLSILLGIWLNLSLLLTNIRHDPSYRNFANFTLTACVRRIVPVILHIPFIKYIGTTYAFQSLCCDFYGFLETFLAVFEVECLTHACIERYVVAKYTTNGWQLKKNKYSLFLGLCFFFATVYSLPPLFGLGQYGYDFSCTSCTFDMVLSDTWQKYFIVMIFSFRSLKPAAIMLTMLTWAHILERKLPCSVTNQRHANLSKSITVVTLVNLVCWTPIAVIRAGVLMSQLVYSDPIVMTSSFYIKWAMWIHWIAPAASVVAMFLVDDRVRNKMINFCAAEIEDDETKKDKAT